MENPFEKIGHPPKVAPKEMKNKVMESVSSFKLILEVMGLFSVDYAKSVESLFNKKQ